jgi:hypothetical protein
MTNLTSEQTELLKYLHSQIGETQKLINTNVHYLEHWTRCRNSPDGEIVGVLICDYEINKSKTNIDTFNHRLEFLVEQLNRFVPTEVEFLHKNNY